MYFERQGKQNTEETIRIAFEQAKELGIHDVVIATSTGLSLDYVTDAQAKGFNVVAVTCAYGSKNLNENRVPEEKRAELLARGIKVCTAAHVLSGAERGISTKLGGYGPVEIMAHTLRMFGQGTKVCVEVAVMAADAGLIPSGTPIISVGGTGGGEDTAIVMRVATANKILDTKIDRILCKPIVQGI